MKNDFLKIILSFTFLLIFLALTNEVFAQCPMCKMAVESNLKNGGTAGKGLNFGILYIFVMPYLLVSVIGFIWWKNRKKEVDELEEMEPKEFQFSEN